MEDKKPSPNWPVEGNVQFQNYSVRYREGLDLVLKNLTLSVKGGEKVGGAIGKGSWVKTKTKKDGFTQQGSVLKNRLASWVAQGPASPP